MGTEKGFLRFASALVCAVWVVSLVGFLDYEPAGFHTVKDAMMAVLSEVSADVDSDDSSLFSSCTPDNPAAAVYTLPDGSKDSPPSIPTLARYGIGRMPPSVNPPTVSTVLRP